MATGSSEVAEADRQVPTPERTLPLARARVARGRRILRVISSFFLGQGAAQGVSVLAGLFLVHSLSVEAYAQFGLASGFQAIFSTLMDLGFASTIVPMVGDRKDDYALVGRYVRSAKHLRDRSFWILAPAAVVAFLAIMHKQHWSWTVQIVLLGSVLLALYSGGKVSYYSAPLFLHGRLRDYYVPQVVSGTCRLAVYVALGSLGVLNAWIAAGLSALNATVNGSWLSRKSRPLLEWPQCEDPATDRELFRYILPAAPAMIFAAFQAQITLFLISIFGGTTYIAEIAALSRIGQLFSVLMTFNMIVVEPYIARLNRHRLLPTFLGLLLLSSVLCIPVIMIAFTYPQVFLWVIGPKYKDLGGVLGWVILSACMNYVASLMWIMNRSRKWVFWSGSFLEIALLLVVQTAFVIIVGVKTTHQAVMLSFTSSFCYLIAHGYVSVRGFAKEPGAIDRLSAQPF